MSRPDLVALDCSILDALRFRPLMSCQEIATALETPYSKTYSRLRSLHRRGKIQKVEAWWRNRARGGILSG